MASALGGMGKLSELKRRLLFVVGALVVFGIGAHIPFPVIDGVARSGLFELLTRIMLHMIQ